MARKIRKFLRRFRKNFWQNMYYIGLFILLGGAIFFAYEKFFRTKMLDRQIYAKTSELEVSKNELNNIVLSDNYKSWDLSKKANNMLKQFSWRKSMIDLISVFNNVKAMGSGDNLVLTDFQVNLDEIKMRGKTNSLKNMYGDATLKGGMITELEKLIFIDHINIPYYKKDTNQYEFDLTAKIKQNADKSATSGSSK